jgi:hypothetical protein
MQNIKENIIKKFNVRSFNENIWVNSKESSIVLRIEVCEIIELKINDNVISSVANNIKFNLHAKY